MNSPSTPIYSAADRDTFIQTMGLAANGVTLVTTTCEGERHGATVSAMCSVTADEPTLLVCLYRESRLAQQISQSKILAVNLLRDDQQALSDRFAGRHGDAERFEAERWHTLTTGAPMLKDALGAFDCQLSQQLECGSHLIFLARVVQTQVAKGNALIYSQRQYSSASPLQQETL